MKKIKETAYLDTQEGVDMILNQLESIDQPLNSQLSSLLQLVCIMSGDVDLVQYLLEKGANPNYMDYRGWTARDYCYFNPNTFAPILISNILEPYEKRFPKSDKDDRRWEILKWALKKDGK